jgi:cytidylate kinase
VIVAIDGPAGSGKSTVAKRLAQRLGYRYLDSGALYRAVTLAALERGVPLDSGADLGRLASAARISLEPDGRVCLDGRDVTGAIRGEPVSASVSQVSAHREVRDAMLSLQRAAGGTGDLVCDGRDMGSVVFPGAELKVYLDASVDVRAERRRKDLLRAGERLSHEELVARLNERDRQDSGRAHAPLRRSEDQAYVDTSDMTIDEVTDRLVTLVSAQKR